MRRRFLIVVLLCMAAALFVALLMVSQPHQVQPVRPSVVASANDQVDASSLLGSWRMDTDATWSSLSKSKVYSKQIDALPPNKLEKAKSLWRSSVDADYCQFTTRKMIWTGNTKRHEMGYTMTATGGNVVTADCVDEKGKTFNFKFAVSGDRLEATEPTGPNPDWVIIYNRAH